MQHETSFDPEPQSARAARRFVRCALAAHGLETEAAELIVSELMANVVRHARTRVQIRVQVDPSAVRLELRDGNAILPAVKDAAEDAESGRGLFIVDALARSWTVEGSHGGKCIRVELAPEVA